MFLRILYFFLNIFFFLRGRKRLLKAPKGKEELQKEFIDAFTDFAGKDRDNIIFIDKSRKFFIDDASDTLSDLILGRLKGRNGYKRLLLGRKGVGKTSLLNLVKDVSIHFGINCLYINFLSPESVKKTLSQSILDFLKLKGETLTDLEKELEKKNKKLLLILDEFQNVYKEDSEIRRTIIQEVSYIGDHKNGFMHCIISGSSSELRLLAFNKLPQAERIKYPSFSGIDLNSIKFTPLWIYPFLEINDFMEVCRLFQVDKKGADLIDFYLASSGFPRLMKEKKIFDNYSITIKGESNNSILKTIFSISLRYQNNKPSEEEEEEETDTETDNYIQRFSSWTQYVSYNILSNQLKDQCEISKIYELCDNGLIRYQKIGSEYYVSLGTPSIYKTLLSNQYSISEAELHALMIPKDDFSELAESAAIKVLTPSSEKWIKLKIPPTELDILLLGFSAEKPIDYLSSISNESIPDPHYQKLRIWREKYGKKMADTLGSDFVIVDEKDKEVEIHRIQLKLGKGAYDDKLNEKVINRFGSKKKETQDAYSLAFTGKKLTITNYLLTPKKVGDSHSKQLEEQGIVTIGYKKLKEANAWPDYIQKLGAPYK